MQPKPIEDISLKDKFVNTIIAKIISGELKVGERLPSERLISEQMQISRNVVRVGLAELLTLGFLNSESRRGTFVSDYMSDGNVLMIDAVCRRNIRISPIFLKSLIDFRMTSLCEAAYLCAIRRTDKNLQRFHELLNEQARIAENDNAEYTRIDFLLHKEIYGASGNMVYSMIHNSIQAVHKVVAADFYNVLPDKSGVFDRHRKIVEAIECRLPEIASTQTRLLLEHGTEVMVQMSYI